MNFVARIDDHEHHHHNLPCQPSHWLPEKDQKPSFKSLSTIFHLRPAAESHVSHRQPRGCPSKKYLLTLREGKLPSGALDASSRLMKHASKAEEEKIKCNLRQLTTQKSMLCTTGRGGEQNNVRKFVTTFANNAMFSLICKTRDESPPAIVLTASLEYPNFNSSTRRARNRRSTRIGLGRIRGVHVAVAASKHGQHGYRAEDTKGPFHLH